MIKEIYLSMQKIRSAFPKAFINMNYELITYPRNNTYFRLEDCETELDIKCKVLEWLSREASKSFSNPSQKYHLNGINKFLGTSFSKEEMDIIYTHLGNACNHEKTIEFIESEYDMFVLIN